MLPVLERWVFLLGVGWGAGLLLSCTEAVRVRDEAFYCDTDWQCASGYVCRDHTCVHGSSTGDVDSRPTTHVDAATDTRVADRGTTDRVGPNGFDAAVRPPVFQDASPRPTTDDAEAVPSDVDVTEGPRDRRTVVDTSAEDASADSSCDGVPEVCNGLDDDCDGEVDEDPPCNGCPSGTVIPDGWVCIPAGEFVMGSPGPECPGDACVDPRCETEECPISEAGRDLDESQHRVSLSAPFLMQSTELTQAEWIAAMGSNPSYHSNCGRDCPVESIGWYDAMVWMIRQSQAEGLTPCYDAPVCLGDPSDGCPQGSTRCNSGLFCPTIRVRQTCDGYRFPSEAEWEVAARAGIAGPIYNLETPWLPADVSPCESDVSSCCAESLDPIAWYICNSDLEAHLVGTRAPNRWGLYDMLGNVWEWTGDWYDQDYGGIDDPMEPVLDPHGPRDGDRGVARGGAFEGALWEVRAGYRYPLQGDQRAYNVGVRPVRSLPTP